MRLETGSVRTHGHTSSKVRQEAVNASSWVTSLLIVFMPSFAMILRGNASAISSILRRCPDIVDNFPSLTRDNQLTTVSIRAEN